jgi:hypothetical protein
MSDLEIRLVRLEKLVAVLLKIAFVNKDLLSAGELEAADALIAELRADLAWVDRSV